MASQRNGAIYVGITNNLIRRVSEHKNKTIEGFTQKYNIDRLVYFETYARPGQAIYREKCLKDWLRAWKVRLIEEKNPDWRDLFNDLFKVYFLKD